MNFLSFVTETWDKTLIFFTEKKFYPCLLGVLILVGFLPLCVPGLPAGHDSGFHLTRLAVIADGLKNGCFPVWINQYALEGFGYAPGLFYSDIFLYPSALLSSLGLSVIGAYKLFLVVWGLLTAYSMYYVVLRISKSYFGAFAGALLYCWSSYYAVDNITRAAIGEVSAFLFVPWCLLGIYEILYGEKRTPIPLACGFAGLFYAHSITFVLTSLITALIFIFNLPLFLRDTRRILSVFIAGIIALLLIPAAIVPMLEQLSTLTFNLTTLTTKGELSERVIPLTRLFLELPYQKMAYWTPPGIGIIFLVVLVQRFRIVSQRSNMERFRDILLIAGVFALLAATNFLPWEGMMSILTPIQFPWRFYMPATALLACGGGLLLATLIPQEQMERKRFWCYILLFGCGFAWSFNVAYTYAAKIHEKNIFQKFTVENAEPYAATGLHYLPAGRNLKYYEGKGGQVFFNNQPEKYELTRPGYDRLKLEITDIKADTIVEIPLNPYAGYQVNSKNYVQKEIIPDFKEGKFLIHLKEPADNAEFTIRYASTKKQLAALFLTLFTTVGLGFFILYSKKKRKNY